MVFAQHRVTNFLAKWWLRRRVARLFDELRIAADYEEVVAGHSTKVHKVHGRHLHRSTPDELNSLLNKHQLRSEELLESLLSMIEGDSCTIGGRQLPGQCQSGWGTTPFAILALGRLAPLMEDPLRMKLTWLLSKVSAQYTNAVGASARYALNGLRDVS